MGPVVFKAWGEVPSAPNEQRYPHLGFWLLTICHSQCTNRKMTAPWHPVWSALPVSTLLETYPFGDPSIAYTALGFLFLSIQELQVKSSSLADASEQLCARQRCLGGIRAPPLQPDAPPGAAQATSGVFNQEPPVELEGSREEGPRVVSDTLQPLLSTASKPVLKDKHMLQAWFALPKI